MESYEDLRKIERENLKTIFQSNPELFKKQTYVDDQEILNNIGIELDNYERPEVFLKFWPEDFIVEELGFNNRVQTIDLPKKVEQIPNESRVYRATLVKFNISTLDAVKDMVRQTNSDIGKIKYAGIKDKVAITAQEITFKDINYSQIKNISSKYYFLKDIKPKKSAVSAGQLEGNRFTLFLRTKEKISEENLSILENKISEISNEGFLNFYYIQRFDVNRLINWHWGLLILKGEYEKTIHHYLTYPGKTGWAHIHNIRKEVLDIYGDWSEIKNKLSKFPLIFRNEIVILEHLEKNPDDYFGALQAISDQSSLWVKAYASYIFNLKLSQLSKESSDLPDSLPLLLSTNPEVQELYKDILEKHEVYPINFENIKSLRGISFQDYKVKTREKVIFKHASNTPNGFLLQFELNKGSYATTLLSQLFTLVAGFPPNEYSDIHFNTTKAVDGRDIGEITQHFEGLSGSPRDLNFE